MVVSDTPAEVLREKFIVLPIPLPKQLIALYLPGHQ